jgi:5,5'-dehydrodivanillate O-demethylase
MAVSNGRARSYTRKDWTDFAHVGPDTLAGRYLRMFWQPVHRSEDLRVGRAIPLKILKEDFTLYRGTSGRAYAVAFRCAHRGTQLSTGWVEGENLRCRYHGWMYDGSGQCVEQPAERNPFRDRVRIRSYPTEEYLGLVFVYFGESEPPPLPRYPDLEAVETREISLHPRMCSFFNNMENSCDEVHIAFTHRDAFDSYVETVPEEIWGEETDYGLIRYGRRPENKIRIAHIHMPNAQQLSGAPRGPGSNWRGTIAWRVPVDDETHIVPHITFLQLDEEGTARYRARRAGGSGPPPDSNEVGAAILAGKLAVEDIVDRRSIVPIQDEVTQVGQGRIADREHERLGESDRVIVLLRQIWSRELRALAEGRPLKQWKRSAELDLPSDE